MIFERNDNLDIETSDENITGSETSMGNVTSMK